jgi:hypothetical protein
LLQQASGLNAEQAAEVRAGNKVDADAKELRLNNDRNFANQAKEVQKSLTDAIKKSLKEQVSAEKSASQELKKAKEKQLENQKKFTEALASLQGGGASGEATYGNAQALKVSARQAVQNGDAAGATKSIDASLAILQKMQDSGQNTLGFAGFIKELQGIQHAADEINVNKAETKVEKVAEKTADLNVELTKLGAIQIVPSMSDDARDAAIKQMEDLRAKLGIFTVPLTLQPTAEMQTIGNQNSASVSFPTQGSAPAASPTAPAASVKAKPAGLKYQQGVTDYSQIDAQVSVAPVPIEPVLADDYYDKMVRDVAAKGSVPVVVEPAIAPNAISDVSVPVSTVVDQAALTVAQNQIASFADQIRRSLTVAVTVLGADSAAPSAPSSDLPSYADGGKIRGPGTGTSDSILAWVSNGEYMVKADAVKHYGPELLRQINERRLPRFAEGGSINTRSLPVIPAPSQALLDRVNPPPLEHLGSMTLHAGGDSYQVQVKQQDVGKILRNQAIKFGRP